MPANQWTVYDKEKRLRDPLSDCRCGKRKYASERDAISGMRRTRKFKKGLAGPLPKKVYDCPWCDGWHMTSQG